MSPSTVFAHPSGVRSSASSRESGWRRAAAAAIWILGWPARYAVARRNLAVLAAMSERQLQDIGLSRADISNVTALPRDEDPTALLADLVGERRAHSRRR
jgi:uncharacterized protein YjiS (DUF1127 family)